MLSEQLQVSANLLLETEEVRQNISKLNKEVTLSLDKQSNCIFKLLIIGCAIGFFIWNYVHYINQFSNNCTHTTCGTWAPSSGLWGNLLVCVWINLRCSATSLYSVAWAAKSLEWGSNALWYLMLVIQVVHVVLVKTQVFVLGSLLHTSLNYCIQRIFSRCSLK